MKDFVNVGLLGAGTVGGGVLRVLEDNAEEIEKKVGLPIRITKVLDRNVEARRQEYGDKYIFTDNADELLQDPEIDIIVELLGREHPAKEFIACALKNGKNVVTANKDVIAKYGEELFPLAEEHHCDFLFEASVCGGIPIIGPMKTSMAANKIHSIMGIVNGTTNYMLSKMSNEHLAYAEVLKEAQAKGYAESDPTADVGGLDAARKIAILASIAFNMRISLDDVMVSGIENIEASDIKYAQHLGYAVKLLGIAKNDEENGVMACVTPTMLPMHHPLSSVNGVYNAVFVNGDAIGEAMFLGLGAGRLPTASAVCGDIIEIARNMVHHSGARINCTCFKEKKLCPPEKISAPVYIRMQVLDKPGALAAIAAAFGAQNVSLRNVVQTNDAATQKAEIVVITHSVSESDLQMALAGIEGITCSRKNQLCNSCRR
ncbi:MAG: homoserine dehydrogenase [Phascolarctobacterium sp.]